MIPSAIGTSVAFTDNNQALNESAKDSPKAQRQFNGNPNQNAINNSALCSSSPMLGNERFLNSGEMVLEKSVASMVSFNSSSDEAPDALRATEALGTKMDVVYSLLAMLSSHDRLQSSEMLLTMSQDRENSALIRQSGCLGLLIQLLHPVDVMPLPAPVGEELEVIRRASEALKNIVRFDADESRQRRDSFILLLVEHVRNYVLHLRLVLATAVAYQPKFCEQAYTAMGTLTKLSYDEDQRRSMCFLGALHCIAEALVLDQKIFSDNCQPMNLDFRRFIGMTLTNLTFGASETKRVLCSNGHFLQTINAQMISQPEELRQVFAGVLRNLSWKTDSWSKGALREAGTVVTLMRSAMEVQKESTLKSVLSALWNLSAHCSENKAKICAVPSALEFLTSTLVYKCPSRSMAVVESGGGILRNISSHIALKEEYRAILRQHNCFQILLEHLQSPSLTIVSNACGTLWNLSAHSVVDQRTLWQLGAEKRLRGLVHSKHKMISLGSAATLKNLLASRPKDFEPNSSNGGSSEMSLMKLRHHRPSDKESNENQASLQCRGGSAISDLATSNEATDSTSTVGLSSAQRRLTPTLEIAAMLNDVTKTVVMTPPFRIPAPPLPKRDRISTPPRPAKNVVADSIGSRANSSIIPANVGSTAKVEKVELDKAAVQRFHVSLQRNNPTQARLESLAGDLGGQYPTDFEHAPMQVPQFYGGFSDQGSQPFPNASSACAFPIVGSPIKSGSMEKQDSIGGLPTQRFDFSRHPQGQQRTPFNKPSGSTTPAEFKSEPSSRGSKSVTALTPLIFSRQSSLESLDSCDQHSVRSTVYSEYSQLPTGIPSPSDLPDSPTNTMPVASGESKPFMDSKQENQILEVGLAANASVDPVATKDAYVEDTLRNFLKTTSIIGDDDDYERPKIYGPTSNKDASQRPVAFNKPTQRQETAVEFNRLSASSSLSALTIDSDIKPEPVMSASCQHPLPSSSGRTRVEHERRFGVGTERKEPEPKGDDICQELQECILAARPRPKSNDGFKTRAIGQLGKNRAGPTTPKQSPAPINGIVPEAADEVDLRGVMQSAMPKPKAVKSKQYNKSKRHV